MTLVEKDSSIQEGVLMIRLTPILFSGLFLVSSSPAYSQLAISARSGMIHYFEGEVRVADKALGSKKGEFARLVDGQILQTLAGRAEVLLTPGVFLRVSEQSELRLDSASLSDTRLELLSGSVLIEVGELEKDHSIRVTASGATLDFRKRGLFRVNASPASVHAYDGEVIAVRGSQTLTVKEGRQTLLAGVLSGEKFAKDETDAFHRWAGRRASYLAAANISSAKSVLDSGNGWNRGNWYFNNDFGMYTYLPGSRNYYSPFGYQYYSPNRVGAIFYDNRAPTNWNQSGGYDTYGGGSSRSAYGGDGGSMRSSGGYSSGGYGGSAPAAAAPAAPAAAPRGSGGGGSRESQGAR